MPTVGAILRQQWKTVFKDDVEFREAWRFDGKDAELPGARLAQSTLPIVFESKRPYTLLNQSEKWAKQAPHKLDPGHVASKLTTYRPVYLRLDEWIDRIRSTVDALGLPRHPDPKNPTLIRAAFIAAERRELHPAAWKHWSDDDLAANVARVYWAVLNSAAVRAGMADPAVQAAYRAAVDLPRPRALADPDLVARAADQWANVSLKLAMVLGFTTTEGAPQDQRRTTARPRLDRAWTETHADSRLRGAEHGWQVSQPPYRLTSSSLAPGELQEPAPLRAHPDDARRPPLDISLERRLLDFFGTGDPRQRGTGYPSFHDVVADCARRSTLPWGLARPESVATLVAAGLLVDNIVPPSIDTGRNNGDAPSHWAREGFAQTFADYCFTWPESVLNPRKKSSSTGDARAEQDDDGGGENTAPGQVTTETQTRVNAGMTEFMDRFLRKVWVRLANREMAFLRAGDLPAEREYDLSTVDGAHQLLLDEGWKIGADLISRGSAANRTVARATARIPRRVRGLRGRGYDGETLKRYLFAVFAMMGSERISTFLDTVGQLRKLQESEALAADDLAKQAELSATARATWELSEREYRTSVEDGLDEGEPSHLPEPLDFDLVVALLDPQSSLVGGNG